MKSYSEGNITYAFPDTFTVLRLGETSFYQKRWQHFSVPKKSEGNKEVDFLVFDPASHQLWMLETKDYRRQNRDKTSELIQEYAAKCRDSLGCLSGMLVSAHSTAGERAMAATLCKARSVRCILHIEQGRRSKLFPSIIEPKDLRDALRRHLRSLDPHAKGGDARALADADVPFLISA
jgi:hypothetical protein